MHFIDFCQEIKSIFEKTNKVNATEITPAISQFFLNQLNELAINGLTDELLQMTQAAILFEGFYQHLGEAKLKNALTHLRIRRWTHNFGVPTVFFLLSYKAQIAQTTQLFNEFSDLPLLETVIMPWHISRDTQSIDDKQHAVIANPAIMFVVPLPTPQVLKGFVKTYNPYGGFATEPCDPVSIKFIEHASILATNGKILEIGAAFGTTTLETLSKGALVFCNDINSDNLAVVHQRYLKCSKAAHATESSHKLILIPGAFPSELQGLPTNFFDAILISRVLHFFTGEKIEESLALVYKLLRKRGKVYITCETPYLKNWQKFIPIFHQRMHEKKEWPGEITNPSDYESSGRAASLPKFVHWMNKEILKRCLLKAGFVIEYAEYFNRKDQFPDDLLLPEYGMESIGAIGKKEH